jgi:hypothetical protein
VVRHDRGWSRFAEFGAEPDQHGHQTTRLVAIGSSPNNGEGDGRSTEIAEGQKNVQTTSQVSTESAKIRKQFSAPTAQHCRKAKNANREVESIRESAQ